MSNTRKAKPKPMLVESQRRSGQRDRVVIAFIHPGETSAFFTTSLVGTLLMDRAGPQRIVGLINDWSSANVSQSRNKLTADFLERDAEWLLWIDADMAWEHDALEQLLAVADPVTAPIVGGLCFGASGDQLFPTIYQMADVNGLVTTVRVNDYPRDSLVRCSATGAAFVLIHRSVLEAMRDRAFNDTFPYFQETGMSGQVVGEDITFCLRAGILGIPVHVNTAVKVGHHKSRLLTEELFSVQQVPSV